MAEKTRKQRGERRELKCCRVGYKGEGCVRKRRKVACRV